MHILTINKINGNVPSLLAKGDFYSLFYLFFSFSLAGVGYSTVYPVAKMLYNFFERAFSDCNLWLVQSQGESVSFLFLFAATCCRKTGCPQSTTLMIACDGLPRCENNIRPAGQVAMQ